MRILIAALLMTAQLAWGQTLGSVSVTSNPTTTNGSASVTVDWTSTPPATSCSITGGGLTGSNLSASGNLIDTGVTKTTIYTVTCSWSNPSNTLKWTPVLTNTDGTPLTDLAGYRIVYSPKGVNNNTTITVSDPTATSLVVTPANPGTYAYVLLACNKGGACSAPTAAVIGPPVGTATATGSATTTVVTLPSTPTGFTVQ